jgi:hypothetical protein
MTPTILLPVIGAFFLLVAGVITWGTPFFWLWFVVALGMIAVGRLALAKREG